MKVGVEMCSIGLYLEDHPRYLPTRIVPPGFFFQKKIHGDSHKIYGTDTFTDP